MRLLLLASLLALPVSAAWQRYVGTPKGVKVDTPTPHPLAYFTEYPKDFCSDCTPEEKLAQAKTVRAELKFVGALAGYEIYDLFYRSDPPGFFETKLILVKSGPDEYREIYYREPSQADAREEPSVFVTVGDEQFLEARYIVGGNHGDETVDYFWLDNAGATLVDFMPVLVAAESVLPRGRTVKWVYRMDGDFPGTHYLWDRTTPLLSRVSVMNSPDNKSPRTYFGIVEVEFKFDRGLVVPTKVSYKPDAPQNE